MVHTVVCSLVDDMPTKGLHTYAISPEVQALIRDLSEEKGLYQSQVVEAGVRLLAELSKSEKEKEAKP
jgi:ABC-type uncharacterized transport system ATPase subunit